MGEIMFYFVAQELQMSRTRGGCFQDVKILFKLCARNSYR